MKKLNVIISKDSKHSLSDWDVEPWYNKLIESNEEETAYLANSLMIQRIKVGVRLGEVAPFEFEFEGVLIKCSETGEFDKWPDGLCDQMIILADSLMQKISVEESEKQYRKSNK